MRNSRLAASLVASCFVLAACGSTVQVRGTAAITPGDGLSGDSSGQPGQASTPGVSYGQLPGTGTPSGGGSNASLQGTATTPGLAADQQSSPGTTSKTATGSAKPAALEPIQVGFLVAKDVGKAVSAMGFSNVSTGDGATQAKASADLVNRFGGLGGHKIDPIIYELDAGRSGSPAAQYAEACTLWFDDHKVQAVAGLASPLEILQCAKKHGVPVVSSFTSIYDSATLAAYPNAVLGATPTLERASTTMIDGLARMGWFKPTTHAEVVKIGLITHDIPQFAVAKPRVEAALRRNGLVLTDTYYMPDPNQGGVGAAGPAGQSAALKFASEGINRVVAMDSNGFGLSWFIIGAKGQGYFPRLGYTSLAQPGTEVTLFAGPSLEGSAAIGWDPVLDVAVADQPTISARTTSCLKALKDRGQDMSSQTGRLGALPVCDATWLLADSLRSGDVTLAGFRKGVTALGTTFLSATVFGTDFTRSNAGVSKYRELRYQNNCSCYKYTSGLQTFGTS
jgi:hypothetical protein